MSAHTKGCRYEGGAWTEIGEGCCEPEAHAASQARAEEAEGAACPVCNQRCGWQVNLNDMGERYTQCGRRGRP